uniref:Uncharacterized protein n=1 Tax=Arundo donax TaxID=35708 RepID=A0A0A9C007_ARUDO
MTDFASFSSLSMASLCSQAWRVCNFAASSLSPKPDDLSSTSKQAVLSSARIVLSMSNSSCRFNSSSILMKPSSEQPSIFAGA